MPNVADEAINSIQIEHNQMDCTVIHACLIVRLILKEATTATTKKHKLSAPSKRAFLICGRWKRNEGRSSYILSLNAFVLQISLFYLHIIIIKWRQINANIADKMYIVLPFFLSLEWRIVKKRLWLCFKYDKSHDLLAIYIGNMVRFF